MMRGGTSRDMMTTIDGGSHARVGQLRRKRSLKVVDPTRISCRKSLPLVGALRACFAIQSLRSDIKLRE